MRVHPTPIKTQERSSSQSDPAGREACAPGAVEGRSTHSERDAANGRSNHNWGDPLRLPYKTERECERCAIVRVTRHEPGVMPWTEFWKDGERIVCDRTPKCEPRR